MDELDAMILREIVWRPADPHHGMRGPRRPWDVARVLGLHGTTVKRRIAGMRESGLLRGVHVQPAPALVGRRVAEHHFAYADAAAKRRAFEYFAGEPTVWTVYGLVGNEVIAKLATPEGADINEAAAAHARETGAIATRFHHATEWPVPTSKVSALDLRILAAFADDAFRPVSEAAADVGIAAKTVTSRMRSLAAARAFLVYPVVDYSRIVGGMAIFLNLTLALGASETAHAEIANRFPLSACRSPRGAENGYVVHHAAGATDVEEMFRRAQTIPGVERVEMRVLHEVHQEPTRWKDALLARAEELARAKGLWAATWRATPDAAARARKPT